MTSEPVHSSDENESPSTKEMSTRGGHFSLADVRQEMDRLWETIMNGRFSRIGVFPQTPPIDMFEKDGQIRIRADLPGMTQGEIQVEVEGDELLISGEKRDERETTEDNLYRSERNYGRFTRRISLPHIADTERASATFKNGVLEIDMPTKPEMGKKKLEIRAGEETL